MFCRCLMLPSPVSTKFGAAGESLYIKETRTCTSTCPHTHARARATKDILLFLTFPSDHGRITTRIKCLQRPSKKRGKVSWAFRLSTPRVTTASMNGKRHFCFDSCVTFQVQRARAGKSQGWGSQTGAAGVRAAVVLPGFNRDSSCSAAFSRFRRRTR